MILTINCGNCEHWGLGHSFDNETQTIRSKCEVDGGWPCKDDLCPSHSLRGAKRVECGLPGCSTGGHDVFLPACEIHDIEYVENARVRWWSSKMADKEFLQNCLRIADDDPFLKVRAFTYYGLARIYGIARYGWKSCFCWPWGKR